MNWITDISLFALLFFLLVFFHELGHFLMAKAVGIKVEKFSIGMGPQLWSYVRGDTEYRLGILPLGGYVKMAGDDPTKTYTEEEKKVGFLTQHPKAKLLVVFGGPVFNLILPVFVFSLMLIIGIPVVDQHIGTVEKNSPADKAGFLSGDQVIELGGATIKEWKQIDQMVKRSADQVLVAKVRRLNPTTLSEEIIKLELKPELADVPDRFGLPVKAGRAGLSPSYIVPQLAVTNSNGGLAKAGLLHLDMISAIDNLAVSSMDQLLLRLKNLSKGAHSIKVNRDDRELTLNFESTGKFEDLGVASALTVIGEIQPNSPAEKAGLQSKDRIVAVAHKEVSSWEEIPEIIRSLNGSPVLLKWMRDGKINETTLTPEKTMIDDPLMGKDHPEAKKAEYRIGISPFFSSTVSTYIDQSFNPIRWFKEGVSKTWEFTSLTIQALSRLFTGQLSVKMLGSPIMIYKVAGNTFRMAGGGHGGWIAFLTNLAMLSITLGLVNLLPIPVLDGGHAVFFTIEWIRGRAISVKVLERATQVGLIALISLFVLVIYNDFDRYGWFDSVLKLFK